jgi:hypothetical protein
MQVLLLAMLFCLAWTGTALAWGPESHVVIAMIAEDRLAPDVKAGIEGRVDRLPPWHLKMAVATGVSASAGGAAAMQRTANVAGLNRRLMALALDPGLCQASLPDDVDDPSRRRLDHDPHAVDVGIDVGRGRDRIDRHSRRQGRSDHHLSVYEHGIDHLLRHVKATLHQE